MFFYWQQVAKATDWVAHISTQRDKILATQHPEFVTVLDISRPYEDCPADERDKITYSGPLYLDFDAPEVHQAIEQVNAYLDKLEERGIDLSQIFMYATGGRGFHLEIPAEVFMQPVPKNGVKGLYAIYKEMAYSDYVAYMDLRVYSGKRGRMWRVPNQQRENGLYKVPVKASEIRAMTAETYASLCSQPRHYVARSVYDERQVDQVPAPMVAEFCSDMAMLYRTAQLKVEDAFKQRKKRGESDAKVAARFEKSWPTTLLRLMGGDIEIRDGTGWNQIAMQIAIVANTMEIDPETVVQAARTLINDHRGDGNRYRTPESREDELRAQLAYTADNPCYSFSVGAIKSLLAKGQATPDLDGIDDADDAQAYADSEAARRPDEAPTRYLLTKAGIKKRDPEGGWVSLCKAGLDNVVALYRFPSMDPSGYAVDVFADGELVRRTALTNDDLRTKATFKSFVSRYTRYPFKGMDSDVDEVMEALEMKVRTSQESNEYLLAEEGLHTIKFPGTLDVPDVAKKLFPLFVSAVGVVMTPEIEEAGMRFTFQGVGNDLGLLRTDIALAPALEATEESRQAIAAVLDMNHPKTLAPILGWMVAAHARTYYHALYSKFPLLGVSGEAGAGKTTTTHLLSKLHFWKREAPLLQAPSTTIFSLKQYMQSSVSVPVLLDEFKPREMPPKHPEQIRAMMRAAYDNGTQSRGGGTGEGTSSWRDVVDATFSAPLVVLSEVPETQTALVERAVSVIFDKRYNIGREAQLNRAKAGADVLSSVGRKLIESLMGLPLDAFDETFQVEHERARRELGSGDSSNHRLIYNYAVALHGLTMLNSILKSVGLHFTDEIENLKSVMLKHPGSVTAVEGSMTARPEAAKVLNDLSMMSWKSNDQGGEVVFGRDYAYADVAGQQFLEVAMLSVWDSYEARCRRNGRRPLYDDVDQFLSSMRNFSGYVDSSATRLTHLPAVYRFRMSVLEQNGVVPFKNKR